MNYYYLNAQGQQMGPVDKSALLNAGINSNTMVWYEGAPQWVAAGSVPDLADILNPQPQYTSQQPQQSQYGAPQKPYGVEQQQYGPQQTQYGAPQPQYGPQQSQYPYGGNNMPVKPQNFMWLGIVTTLLCCWPVGVASIVFASKSNTCWNRGDYQGAEENANKAKTWGIVSAIAGLVVFFIAFISGLANSL